MKKNIVILFILISLFGCKKQEQQIIEKKQIKEIQTEKKEDIKTVDLYKLLELNNTNIIYNINSTKFNYLVIDYENQTISFYLIIDEDILIQENINSTFIKTINYNNISSTITIELNNSSYSFMVFDDSCLENLKKLIS